ncbi:MAG: segregation/condensation protein A [Candidatus Aenigmatarchaeota archaeon]
MSEDEFVEEQPEKIEVKSEENLIKLIIEKENWEEVIYQIVSLENLNPWDIDLLKLSESFLKYISKLEELDFRIPAKIVFVAAILLRLKADYLSIFEEEETIEEIAKKQPFIDIGIDPNLIQLGLPMKRMPKRQITLEELMSALNKAMKVKENRVERRMVWEQRLEAQITAEDITVRIERMMDEIEELMKKMKDEKITFSQVVKKWKRDEIVSRFIPLLHLEQNHQIETHQEDFFKEIYIFKRNENMNKEG